MKEKTSYNNETYWKNYQPYFPEHLRLNTHNRPKEEWWNWRGMEVHIDRYLPKNKLNAKVIMLHGGGGYSRLLSPIAVALHSAGYEVVIPDLPGYGLTSAPSEYVDYQRWSDLIVDLTKFEYKRCKQPIILYGLSLGGMLAYYAAARSDLVKGVIASTLCDPRFKSVSAAFSRFPKLNGLSIQILKLLLPFIGKLKLPLKWFSNMKAISNHAKFNELVTKDSIGGGNRTPVNFMLSILTATPQVEPEQFSTCPVLLVHPAEDKWTPFELSDHFYQRLSGTKKVVLLEKAGHMPLEQPGLNTLNHEVLAFLSRTIKSGQISNEKAFA